MGEVLLYGLDDRGEPAFSEVLGDPDRTGLRALAEARLREWHAVEVWDGPLCVVRLRRKPALAD